VERRAALRRDPRAGAPAPAAAAPEPAREAPAAADPRAPSDTEQ
jgi:hypothetical protein